MAIDINTLYRLNAKMVYRKQITILSDFFLFKMFQFIQAKMIMLC